MQHGLDRQSSRRKIGRVTRDQKFALLRWCLTSSGSALGGWFLAKGWVTQDQLTWLANNSVAIVGILGSVGAGIWTMISRKQVNMVAAVAAMPEVAKVTTAPTVAGAALADKVGTAPGVAVVKG